MMECKVVVKQRSQKATVAKSKDALPVEPQPILSAASEQVFAQPDIQELAVKQLVLTAIDKFIEMRRSEWGQIGSQIGEFNPHVVRYDMLQKFRKAVENGDLGLMPMPIADLDQVLFEVWRSLCLQAVADSQIWGHPIALQQIYSQLPFIPWEDFLMALSQTDRAESDTTQPDTTQPDTTQPDRANFELVPSRVRNWLVNGRQVGALTFHQEPSIIP
jgi:hypothetical protein